MTTLLALAQGPAALPENLRVPVGEKLVLKAHGAGDQVYVCKAGSPTFSWTLKAPDAKLLDRNGRLIGRHFAGPTWESADGSRVVGKAAATVASPDPNSVPWLRLQAIRHEGAGILSDVNSIQRIDTKRRKAPRNGLR